MPTKSRILIVDNEPEIQEILAQFLTSPKTEILQASNREDALKIIAAQPKDSNLTLIVDVVLHGESGVDLARECAAKLPNIRIIFISGYANDVLFINEKVPASHISFLQKPFSKDDLVSLIEKLRSAGK